MKKTPEQMKAEFIRLLEQNGFALSGEGIYGSDPYYARRWSKEVEVLWHGKSESTLEIRAVFKWGGPRIAIFQNGRHQDARGYTSPKRCLNAMREIVSFAGFEF
jgi:predicted RNA binding protein YcfA (HicA-like mRNA interferase family)